MYAARRHADAGVVGVNGTVIARDAIAREVQNHSAPKPILAWQSAARALVVRELLLQRARQLGLSVQPLRHRAGRREAEEEALVRALLKREVATPEPDPDACRRYYEQNRHRFRSPAIFEAAHILFRVRRDDTATFAAAQDKAWAVLDTLKADPGQFGTMARLHSTCPSAAQGGNLGQITTGQTTPELERALSALEPGTMTPEPVVTRYGPHIIRLDRRIEPRDLPFALAADRIAVNLRESVTRPAIAQYIARLVSAPEITGIALDGAEQHRVS